MATNYSGEIKKIPTFKNEILRTITNALSFISNLTLHTVKNTKNTNNNVKSLSSSFPQVFR